MNSRKTMKDLRSVELPDANLRYTDLQNADLQDANLQNANLRGADLQNADLQDANLQNADLRGADLQNADLRYADLQNANLQGADLRCANLRGANLRGTHLVIFQADRYTAFVQPGRTTIGCTDAPNAFWLSATQESIEDLDPEAASVWRSYSAVLKGIIEAVETENRQ